MLDQEIIYSFDDPTLFMFETEMYFDTSETNDMTSFLKKYYRRGPPYLMNDTTYIQLVYFKWGKNDDLYLQYHWYAGDMIWGSIKEYADVGFMSIMGTYETSDTIHATTFGRWLIRTPEGYKGVSSEGVVVRDEQWWSENLIANTHTYLSKITGVMFFTNHKEFHSYREPFSETLAININFSRRSEEDTRMYQQTIS